LELLPEFYESKDFKRILKFSLILIQDHGKIIGGRLFSETILFTGEIDLQEMIGEPLERVYDDKTGLRLWNLES